MDPLGVIVTVAIVGVVVPTVMRLTAPQRDRGSAVVLIILWILGAVIVIDAIAITTDFQDADGYIDCWPGCSTWQTIIQYTLGPAIVLLLPLAIVAVFREFTSRRKSEE
jgi:hypothetical protein